MIDTVHTLSILAAGLAGTSLWAGWNWYRYRDSARFWGKTALDSMERAAKAEVQVIRLEVELDEMNARLDA